eukprot:Phypoly_transcript_00981.p1 GENE.Phypoly_transcript_00981~~Phypoly_transcript_00981.p1  ORF type:complete len:1215 (+),score=308.92 Phypoly_transcript_00981:23-3646(+)
MRSALAPSVGPSPGKGIQNNKENVENNVVAPSAFGTDRKKKKRRSRVSFSHLVDVRLFEKGDALSSSPVSDAYPASASPGKQTTVILSEKKEQLKAAHEAKNEPQAPAVPHQLYGGYTSPEKSTKSNVPPSPMLESPKFSITSDQDLWKQNINDMFDDVSKSGQKRNSAGKPIPRSPLLLASPSLPRPTSTVPTLNSLLEDGSPYKPSASSLQCLEEIAGTARDRKRRGSGLGRKTRDSISGDASVDMSITQTYGGIVADNVEAENEDDMEETTTASNILTTFANNSENDNRYNTTVDNYVVDYDSDISMTIHRSKVPGFNNLYDEDDMSMTNIINPNNMSANDSQISNNSELDMSLTQKFKFPTAPSNRADVTNHFISDMSILNQTTNKPNTSLDNSADMSLTCGDIRKLVDGNNESMDMSITMRIPTAPNDDSAANISAQRIVPEFNTFVNNFVVNYDDDMSMTMHFGGKKPSDQGEEVDREELTSKYNKIVDNYVVSYNDDVTFNTKPNESIDRDDMTMTMTREDFNRILQKEEEEEIDMTMTGVGFGKITVANTSMNASMDESFSKELNTSAGKLNTSVGKLNTSAGKLNTSAGKLNTSAEKLNTSAGKLNTSAGKLNTSAGKLNTSAEKLNTSAGKLNTSAGKLNTSAGKLNTSAGKLNTSAGKLNTSAGKLMTQDLLTNSPLPTNKILTKIMTPNKTPSQNATANRSFLADSSFSQSLPILPSHQSEKVSPSESLSNISMDEMLHESVRKDAATDQGKFCFAQFLDLAEMPNFNQSRYSILGPVQKISDEEPSTADRLESAFLRRHDKSTTQTECEQLRALAAEKKQAAERLEKLLASSLSPPRLYSQLQDEDPAERAKAQKQAQKLRKYCQAQAKIELLERQRQAGQALMSEKRHGLELLRQDAARLAGMIKSLQVLTDELPSDVKKLEQTKQQQMALQIQTPRAQAPSAQQPKIYTLSSSAQTERLSAKSSKRARSDRTADLQRQMNQDFALLQLMRQTQHWIPRILTEKEILIHWDLYKVHVIANPVTASFGLIDPSVRFNDFQQGMLRNANIDALLKTITHEEHVVPALHQVFHQLQRMRAVTETVRRLSTTYHVRTDRNLIRHTSINDDCGVIEVQFSDHRATTKFGVIFELTCAYPFSLDAFPRKPLFGRVTTAGIAATIATIQPGYERLERACAALLDLAVEGKDPNLEVPETK